MTPETRALLEEVRELRVELEEDAEALASSWSKVEDALTRQARSTALWLMLVMLPGLFILIAWFAGLPYHAVARVGVALIAFQVLSILVNLLAAVLSLPLMAARRKKHAHSRKPRAR